MAEETLHFQAEVSKLLDIVVHSLYSNKEIFLRELISNASDACDRLRYAALTEPALLDGEGEFKIRITPDKTARTLTIEDNGIGMSRDDLVDNLGTIARSGTSNFLSQLSGDAKRDTNLIGQFGVGFYSAFMIADKVEVHSRKAGETHGWRWTSDGKGAFTIAEEAKEKHGTTITLHLRDGENEFLESYRLTHIIKTYSDHIAIPVVLIEGETEDTANSASALWTRNKSEITPEQYKEFYHHVAHAFDEPAQIIHYKAEGAIEYSALLYVPSSKPFDLFNPDRKQHVKLYVRRVFITDDCSELLPGYLRFLRGVVDSQDLPLNVSREMLQHNPILAKIRSGLVKRVLGDLKKRAADDAEAYLKFWAEFGPVLKEGIYEDFERKTDILELARFQTTLSDTPISLASYVERLKEGQEAIYTLTGEDAEALKKSPLLEGFRAKGIEVLLLTDPIDEFWVNSVPSYQDKPLRSIAQAGADLSKIASPDNADAPKAEEAPGDQLSSLIAAFKLALGEAVKDVKSSDRLTESAVCLVAAEGDVSMNLERMLRQNRQQDNVTPRVLEINPRHALIRSLAQRASDNPSDAKIADAAHLLLDQAQIVEGETVSDPTAFARRLASVLSAGL